MTAEKTRYRCWYEVIIVRKVALAGSKLGCWAADRLQHAWELYHFLGTHFFVKGQLKSALVPALVPRLSAPAPLQFLSSPDHANLVACAADV